MRWAPEAGAWVLAAVVLSTLGAAAACGPGRVGGGRRLPRKLTPLVFKQHIPNVSENTLAASGLADGRIDKDDPRFRNLESNYNRDIIFKDEEGTGADRVMTQRCKEKLNTLAISVMNQWPGVKLRVTEGWDEEGHHAADSLHYEGRAVDVTTSDRDRSKYGMLARLAVEAGFDWVYYESRAHIHCSVKSESSQSAKHGGCFTANSTVRTSSGEVRKLSELRVGEKILALDESSGQLIFSEVVMFLDRNTNERREFLRLETSSRRTITLTPAHLLIRGGISSPTESIFAESVRVGDEILIRDENGKLKIDRVLRIKPVLHTGVFAPLTTTGTVVVDDVVASCYAIIDSQSIAHWSFAPVRFALNLKNGFLRLWQLVGRPVTGWSMAAEVSRESPNQGMEMKEHAGAKYSDNSLWYIQVALITLVGGVVVVTLVMCYVYILRQLCCPAPRAPRRRRRRCKTGVADAVATGAVPHGTLPVPDRSTRAESLPLTNVISQPTETEHV